MNKRSLRRSATRPNLAAWARAVAVATLACAASVQAATLSEIYDLALKADAQYAGAKAAAAAGREKSVQGRAGIGPTVNLSGSVKQVMERTTALTLNRRPYDTSQVALTATQPLYRKANWEAYEQGELQAQLAEFQLRLAEQELLVRVSKGYFDVLQAQDALASIGAQKQAFAQQLAQAKRALEVGTAPITDVNEAQARHDLTVAQEIAARNDLEIKQRALEKAIDRELPPLARLREDASIDVIENARLRELVERAPEESLLVAASQLTESIARREVSRQEGTAQPTADVVIGYNEVHNGNFTSQGNNRVRQGSVALEVGFPVYQGGAYSSRVREAVANLERATQERINAQRQARLEARQAYLGVSSGSALHQALRQALLSSQSQVRSTQRGFEVGVRTRVDVLNAEQQLYATRKDLAGSRYQTLVAGLQLKAAAGALTEMDLKALDRLLEP